ncbi:helix-hairpin-helix domain-containing protein [Halomicroarcula sp. F13]|uniref:Helix-hairpin-helix domain-containing protein n=1 Tax=Haloarcula rubra TaxID=2487747 RepID=A0AAW4PVS3_9EURY|nr:helix-hairpin-helix domain-containing protein [Halomicroarcula rubra]MBX0325277.1 helix-hairpin-helix domain-containing protein [Halomicroarcula rubra]
MVTTLSNDLFHNFPAKFDSVADLHVANTDDLQRVDSIGNKTAEKLQHER